MLSSGLGRRQRHWPPQLLCQLAQSWRRREGLLPLLLLPLAEALMLQSPSHKTVGGRMQYGLPG